MSPRRRRLSPSRTTIQRTGCELPPVAALVAASTMVSTSASDTSRSGSKRRMARVVAIASKTSMSSLYFAAGVAANGPRKLHDETMTESRDAYAELLATLEEIGQRFAGEEWGITDPNDVAETLRLAMHLLCSGIETQFDDDAARPVFRQIVTPWRKCLGDNADAMYHDAKVHPAGVYRVRGNTGGAIYVSCTIEA